MPFRAVTWNCRGASNRPALWDYLVELSPDIAVLQEVSRLPESVRNSFAVREARPPGPSGRPQSFQSVLLVRGTIGEPVRLRTDLNWVNLELEYFAANLMAYQVQVGSRELNVMGAYSPAWPLSRERLAGEDLSGVKLEHSPDVWVVDLVVAAMREELRLRPADWVIAGDFNTSETFDAWRGGPHGNREWLDRMASLGLIECLRQFQGVLTPTFRAPGVADPKSQIDHLFVTSELAPQLTRCATGEQTRVYGESLSDHLPIVADFG